MHEKIVAYSSHYNKKSGMLWNCLCLESDSLPIYTCAEVDNDIYLVHDQLSKHSLRYGYGVGPTILRYGVLIQIFAGAIHVNIVCLELK